MARKLSLPVLVRVQPWWSYTSQAAESGGFTIDGVKVTVEMALRPEDEAKVRAEINKEILAKRYGRQHDVHSSFVSASPLHTYKSIYFSPTFLLSTFCKIYLTRKKSLNYVYFLWTLYVAFQILLDQTCEVTKITSK